MSCLDIGHRLQPLSRTFRVCAHWSPFLVQRTIVLSAEPVRICVGEMALMAQTVCS